MAMVYIREGESAIKKETRENIYVSDRCLSVCVLSIWRKTDEKECRCSRGKNKYGVQAAANPGSVHNMQRRKRAFCRRMIWIWFRRPVRISSRNFVTSNAQVGFLGGMLRDGEKKRRDPRDIKALVRAGIV